METQLKKNRTPVTLFREGLFIKFRHSIIDKLHLSIDVNLLLKRHQPDSPDAGHSFD